MKLLGNNYCSMGREMWTSYSQISRILSAREVIPSMFRKKSMKEILRQNGWLEANISGKKLVATIRYWGKYLWGTLIKIDMKTLSLIVHSVKSWTTFEASIS